MLNNVKICYNEKGDMMESNKEIRNDELKMSMITYKLQDDKESEDYFIGELRKAYLLIPALDDDNDNELTFMLLCNQNNDNYFQAYTDLDAYNKWDISNESRYFILTFDELANIVISSEEEVKGLVINPFNENIILNKEAITNIFTMDKTSINFETTTPIKIKNKIKKILGTKKEIKKAYLFNMKKSNIPGYLLVINSTKKDIKELSDKIGREILESVDQINIDIISSNDKIIKDIISKQKPFYEKK